jgi:ATP-binding cassette, subfamily C, bacterial CydD
MNSSATTVWQWAFDSESAWNRLGVANTPCDPPQVADEHERDDSEGLYAPERARIAKSVVALSVRALLLATAAVVIGSIIDAMASGEAIAPSVWWLAALPTGAAVMGWLLPPLAAATRTSVESTLRNRILDVVFHNPSDRFRTGAVTNLATEGSAAVGSLAGRFLPQLIGGVVIPILVSLVVVTIDVPSALILLVAIPSVPLLLRLMEKRFTKVTNRYRETADRLTSEFFDGIQGMATLRAMGGADLYEARLEQDSERLRAETMALLRVNQVALFVVDSLFTLGTVVAAGGAAFWRVQQGAISVGEGVAIIILGMALIEPISQVGRFFYVGAIGRAAARDIKRFLGDDSRSGGLVRRSGEEGWIELTDVSFAYGNGTPVLENVSLRVEPKEVLGVVGPSGTGKSTLAGLVAGLLQPDEGRVDVGGRVAVVSQRAFLFHGTLRENLLLADPTASDDELRTALGNAGLDEIADREGLDLQVGERGLQLSGGEAQRLTIARMLLADAPIIVLDEPTSNVDIETEARIRHALARLTADKTVVVIAHRRSTLAGVDRVITVGRGTVAEASGLRW